MIRRLLPWLIRALASTWRFRSAGTVPEAPCVIAFWHDEMLPVWKLFARKEAVALTSKSRDGALLAALLQQWEYIVVRGSSSRHGKEALEEIVGWARERYVLMTPDGPRGPRHEFKPGAVVAAHRAGVPVYLCMVKAKGIRLNKSWDKFLIPFPFAAIDVVFSFPIEVPEDTDRESIGEIIHKCQNLLNRI